MNDYILVSELYHTGVKGMKWGIRKEYSKKESARTKKYSTIGKMIGAGLGAVTALGIGYFITSRERFVEKGKEMVGKLSGKSYSSINANIAKKAIGAALVGGYLGKKIGKYSAKEKSAQERIDYMVPKKTQKGQ